MRSMKKDLIKLWRYALLIAARRTHYISTHCIDGLHAECRLWCKHCKKICRCPFCCHAIDLSKLIATDAP